jgi:Ca2+-binding RTX toxin-like protein
MEAAGMRGRKTLLSLAAIAAMLLMSAVSLAHEGRTPGTNDSDELTLSDGNDRVFARGGDDVVDGGAGNDRIRGGRGADELSGGEGDDRLRGGQDSDHLDGGPGDDHLNGRGDGRDADEIVCGDGYDVAVLGRGDVVVDEDACEKVRAPGVRKHKRSDEAIEEPCAARYTPRCGDPEVVLPAPDEPVEEPARDEPGEV